MNPPLHIVVLEDHIDLCELLVELLRDAGHAAVGFALAEELDDYLVGHPLDLLVLDLNLPGEEGLSVARRLRESYPALHIIMVTARSTLADRVSGYASGADLYLTKPLEPVELVAAVHSIARRVAQARMSQPDLVLDLRRLILRGPAGQVALTAPEAGLLKALAEAPDRRLEHWRLFDLLRLEAGEGSKSVLEVRLSRLKKKLHQAGAPAPAIQSVRKFGYRLGVAVRVED